MPSPPGLVNLVRITANDAASINSEITTQNTATFWLTDIKFDNAGQALLLFVKTNYTGYGYTADQKVNSVDIDQTDIDADIAAEAPNGYFPTGIFVDNSVPDMVYILYQQLDIPPAP